MDLLPSIPELLKIYRNSFPENDFDELQDILTNREGYMKKEIQILARELQRKSLSLEDSQRSAELHKLSSETSERKCRELLTENEQLNEQLLELRQKQAELKRQNVETTTKLEERIGMMESVLSSLLNVKEKDLASLAAFTDNSAADGDFVEIIKSWKESDSTNVGAENLAIVPHVVCATSNAIQSDDTPLVLEGGDGTVVQPRTEEDVARDSVLNSSAQDDEASNTPAAYISIPAHSAETSAAQKYGKRSDGLEDYLEKKKRRAVAGGTDAGSVHTCEIRDVVCDSAPVFSKRDRILNRWKDEKTQQEAYLVEEQELMKSKKQERKRLQKSRQEKDRNDKRTKNRPVLEYSWSCKGARS